jgi:hypothetical protein
MGENTLVNSKAIRGSYWLLRGSNTENLTGGSEVNEGEQPTSGSQILLWLPGKAFSIKTNNRNWQPNQSMGKQNQTCPSPKDAREILRNAIVFALQLQQIAQVKK